MDEERTGFITVAMVKQKMEGDHSCLQSDFVPVTTCSEDLPASSKRPHTERRALSANHGVCRVQSVRAWHAGENKCSATAGV